MTIEEILTIAIVMYCDSWNWKYYCDTIAIVVILLRYYYDSCDTIAIVVILLSTIEFSAPQASSGSKACILRRGGPI